MIINDNGCFSGIDRTDILEAMFGEATITATKGNDGIQFGETFAGRNKRMTETCSTSVSALGNLYGGIDYPCILVYHNHFASVPIDPSWFVCERFQHFRLATEGFSWQQLGG